MQDDSTTPMTPTPPVGRYTYVPGTGKRLPSLTSLWLQNPRNKIAITAASVMLTLFLCCGSIFNWALSPDGQKFSAQVAATQTVQAAATATYAQAHPKPSPTATPQKPGSILNNPLPGTPTTTTSTTNVPSTPTATSAPLPTTNTPLPTATTMPPTPIPPTATAMPPTPIPPTATAMPPTPIPPTATPIPQNTCGAPANPWNYTFCGGNLIYNPPGNFCNYFNCIPSFWKFTSGYVNQCSDGTYSHSGGRPGTCSSHGNEARPLYGP